MIMNPRFLEPPSPKEVAQQLLDDFYAQYPDLPVGAFVSAYILCCTAGAPFNVKEAADVIVDALRFHSEWHYE